MTHAGIGESSALRFVEIATIVELLSERQICAAKKTNSGPLFPVEVLLFHYLPQLNTFDLMRYTRGLEDLDLDLRFFSRPTRRGRKKVSLGSNDPFQLPENTGAHFPCF